jgi:hypothetical protein
MPELDWTLGYPFALALMVLLSVGLYVAFKREVVRLHRPAGSRYTARSTIMRDR